MSKQTELAEVNQHLVSQLERLTELLAAADTAISAMIGQGNFGRTHMEDVRAHDAAVAYQALKENPKDKKT